ncbi:condensation domain-containing protein [Uliginosibacterium aquaticum]|uniref:Condensation protein n=1 Tax=Uliginosibacterium aquaticum TaxID=2731212 RepID=A0ABX2ID90_9RHOO|nr:condensation domain-containing protein [Uliginosibacterium aquaticum]NSL54544.1 condensation protein [Uliginosibacterium aquaticum]
MTATAQRLPTTSAQYGIWVAQQMSPESPAYLTAEVIELRGLLDQSALSATVVEVLNHCASLHMRFEADEQGLWQWPRVAACPPLAVHDFGAEADPQAAAQAWMKQSLAVLCDPSRDVLYRTVLLRLGEAQHLWYLQVHHIALDGFGYSLLCQSVAERYSARVRGEVLAALPDWSLGKVLQAEQVYRETGQFLRDQAFWSTHLMDVPPPARIDPAQNFCDEVRRCATRLSGAELDALRAAAQACGQDWGSWMLAAIGLWLARHSGQRSLTFGMPVMNRLGTPALGVPCMAMNILPMSLVLGDAPSMLVLSRQIAQRMRSIRPHLYYRYGWIRMDLGLMAQGKHLFNQAVNLLPFDRSAPFTGLQATIHPVTAGPVKDLNISVFVLNAEWQLRTEANPAAYDEGRLQALHEDLLGWLRQLAVLPAQQGLDALLPQGMGASAEALP